MMAVSINTRPSIRVVRTLPSASGWRAMRAAGSSQAYGNASGQGLGSQASVSGLGSGLGPLAGGKGGHSQQQNSKQRHNQGADQSFMAKNEFHM